MTTAAEAFIFVTLLIIHFNLTTEHWNIGFTRVPIIGVTSRLFICL